MRGNTLIGGNSAGNRNDPLPNDNDNIHRLNHLGKSIILIGTAHVSGRSSDLVGRVIEEERPEAVCVELCRERYTRVLQQGSGREDINLIDMARKQKGLFLPWLILWYLQKRIGDKLGMKPGAEMVRAIEAAKATGAGIYPVDRDFRLTLERAWKQMGFMTRIVFMFQLIFALGSVDKVREEDIERLKREDVAEKLTKELGEFLPGLRRALVDERDEYMSERILEVPAEKIVAVVGAGHVPGILRRWCAAGIPDPGLTRKAA